MSEIRVDTISEKTSANGVAVDGVTLKDGGGTFTSPVLVPDGSTSAVSLGNDGDPNTGIYFQAADSLGLVLGGSRKLSATSAGIAIENGTLSAKGGAVFNEDSADVDFRVESNGNTHMLFVDGGNNRVGVGTTPDLGVGLHIRSADSGASVDSNADELIVEGSASSGISILSGTGNEGAIKWGDSGDNNIGFISYDHAGNDMYIGVNAAARVKVHDNGVAAFNNGVALGVGTANTASNVLDDYEEGTFTYTISGSNSGNLVLRSGYERGEYIKIGNQVMIHLRFETSSDNSISGNLQWSLPFTMANANANDAGNAVAPGYIRDNSLGTDYRTGVYLVGQSEAYAQLLFSREGAATSTVELATDSNTDGVMEGVISIFYRTT